MTVADVRWEMPARFAAICSPGWMMKGSTDRSLSVCSSFYTELLNLDARANPLNSCTRHRCCHDVLSRLEQVHTTSHLGLPTWADGLPWLSQQRPSASSHGLPDPGAQGHPEKRS